MSQLNFAFPDPKLGRLAGLDASQLRQLPWTEFNFSRSNWVLQAYVAAKQHFPDALLSADLLPAAINIAMCYDLPRLPPPRRPFVVGVRADYPPCRWASVEVVQNKSQLSSRSVWMPHFPQPGLKARSQSRADVVKTVGYFGSKINHHNRITRRSAGLAKIEATIRDVCTDLGLSFIDKANALNDYSDVDVAIGLRSFSRDKYNSKPASKLVNAWIAEAPFIGGCDSAYADVGEPGWNYLRVSTPEAFKSALMCLRDDEQLRHRMIRAGRSARSQYGYQEVVDRWISLLGSCADQFSYPACPRLAHRDFGRTKTSHATC